MIRIKTALSVGVAALSAIGFSAPAHASLILDNSVVFSAQGFGTVPRDLTIQETGQRTGTESGCVGVSGTGGITFGSGSCVDNATQVFAANGVQNVGGDEPNPLADNQKYGIPTLSSLGITSADQIAILFNAAESGGDALTLADLTLKIYSSTGALLAAIDTAGPEFFSTTNPGTGSAGFVFTVDAAQQTYLNTVFSQAGSGDYRFALEATVTGSGGGSENFTVLNKGGAGAVPEPATWAMMLFGFGGIGFAMRRRKSEAGTKRMRFANA